MNSAYFENYKKQFLPGSADRGKRLLRWVIIGTLAIGLAAIAALGITPMSGGSLAASPTEVNVDFGEQLDPHVSGNFAAYTDYGAGGAIEYFSFLDSSTTTI